MDGKKTDREIDKYSKSKSKLRNMWQKTERKRHSDGRKRDI